MTGQAADLEQFSLGLVPDSAAGAEVCDAIFTSAYLSAARSKSVSASMATAA
jgi:hypothetical protein